MIRRTVILLIGLVFLLSAADAKAPLVYSGLDCTLMASDGSYFAAVGKEVIKTDNKITITCTGIQPAEIPYPDRAVQFDYANTAMLYATDFGMIQEWKEIITPSGLATLRLKINLK